MNYSQFLEMLVREVQDRFGRQAFIHINQVQKINQPVVDGMTILLPGENASPAFYLDSIYQDYQNGTSLSELADQILTFYQENKRTGICDLSFYKDFEKAHSNIICRLVNYKMNEDLLKHVPHRRFLDFAIVCYYVMDNPEFGKSSILVRDDHIALWGITPDELLNIAIQNTRQQHPFRITTLCQAIGELIGYLAPYSDDPPAMYILTNKEMCYGAINLIFEDILRNFSDDIGGDFYVLPSSIHECLLLPISPCNAYDPKGLQEMVSEINQKPEIVSPEDILGDRIYRYVRETHKLYPAISEQ